jgi:hypothetical protein
MVVLAQAFRKYSPAYVREEDFARERARCQI